MGYWCLQRVIEGDNCEVIRFISWDEEITFLHSVYQYGVDTRLEISEGMVG